MKFYTETHFSLPFSHQHLRSSSDNQIQMHGKFHSLTLQHTECVCVCAYTYIKHKLLQQRSVANDLLQLSDMLDFIGTKTFRSNILNFLYILYDFFFILYSIMRILYIKLECTLISKRNARYSMLQTSVIHSRLKRLNGLCDYSNAMHHTHEKGLVVSE